MAQPRVSGARVKLTIVAVAQLVWRAARRVAHHQRVVVPLVVGLQEGRLLASTEDDGCVQQRRVSAGHARQRGYASSATHSDGKCEGNPPCHVDGESRANTLGWLSSQQGVHNHGACQVLVCKQRRRSGG